MTKINMKVPAAMVALLFTFSQQVHAQQEPQTPPAEASEASEASEAAEVEIEADTQDDAAAREDAREDDERGPPFRWHSRSGNVIVHFGDDSHLPEGEQADAVISIFGSSTAAGEVDEAVVSIFGDTRATGPVRQSAVAVFGNTYVNNYVGSETVAVFGDVTLGPQAEVYGDVVAVGGRVIRDPQARIHGDVSEVAFGEGVGRMEWLRTWFEHCLLYGRLLAIEPGLGWAWGIAFAFLALYVLLALMFSDSVNRCVHTLETKPGQSVLAALLSVLLTPFAFMLLVVTVIGVVLVPFLGLALFVAGLFGKAVVLAWMGRRATRFTGIGAFEQAAFPVLVGGLIMMGVYLVPVLGFIAYKVAGILGLGVVLYTALLAMQARRGPPEPAVVRPAPAGGPSATMPAGAAAMESKWESTRQSTDQWTDQPSDRSTEQSMGEAAQAVDEAQPQSSAGPAAPAAAPPAETALSAPLAGFWIRMAALFIDAVLVGVIASFLEPAGEVWLVALAGYGALMWKLKSTTIGGIVCNLQVVRVDGREIDWDTAIVRALSCFLSLAAAGLGFLWIAFDPQRQSWHDKIAGTLVVRTQRGSPLV